MAPPSSRGISCIRCGDDSWYGRKPSRCATCVKRKSKLQYDATRARVLAAYGGCCQCCGETTEEFLVIDHINGGGTQHLQALGYKLYRWLIKHDLPEGFQVLCANCNQAKERPGGCPHLAEAMSANKERERS